MPRCYVLRQASAAADTLALLLRQNLYKKYVFYSMTDTPGGIYGVIYKSPYLFRNRQTCDLKGIMKQKLAQGFWTLLWK